MPTPDAMPWRITPTNRDPAGQLHWNVVLPDGRDAYMSADRIDISRTGDLLLYADDSLLSCLSAGSWVACYAASVIDGAAVQVASVPAPKGPQP